MGWPTWWTGGVIRGVHLLVIVAAALERPDLVVAHRRRQRLGARIAAEEVFANVGAVVGLVGLVVAVRRGVHQVHQGAVLVGVQQRVPLAPPDHLDDVPACATEERLQFLDDLAVAADRTVEALQIAVDDVGQVVQPVDGRQVDQAARFDLVQLAVAQERPDVLLGGVLDAAVVQIAVDPGLGDGVHRAESHGHRRVLPEVRHQPRVRVGRAARRPGARPPGGSRRGCRWTAAPRGRRGRTCRGRRGPGRRRGRRRRGGSCRGRSGCSRPRTGWPRTHRWRCVRPRRLRDAGRGAPSWPRSSGSSCGSGARSPRHRGRTARTRSGWC